MLSESPFRGSAQGHRGESCDGVSFLFSDIAGFGDTSGLLRVLINQSGIHNGDLVFCENKQAYSLSDIIKTSGSFQCPVRKSFYLAKGLGVTLWRSI